MDTDFPLSVEESGNNPRVPFLPATSRSPVSDCRPARPPLQLTLSYGNLEQQKADVIAAPLVASRPDLDWLRVTKDLKFTAGEKFSKCFDAVLNGRNALPPGSHIEIPGAGSNTALECKWVIFIACNPWHRSDDSSVQNLRSGIYNFLEKCNSLNVESVHMSAIGTGAALNFRNEVAATIIGEEIKNLMIRHPNTSIKKIQLVIKKLPESEIIFIAFRETLLEMDLGERIILRNEEGGCFRKIQTGETMTKKVGRLSVSVVHGDIVKESTHAIVNSTNFTKWSKDSVAYSIFQAAGEELAAAAKDGISKKGNNYINGVLMTKAGGLLRCNWILHCNCEGNYDKIKDLVKSILERCDDVGLQSVAIPAIGTGECRLCPKRVADCLMKTISSVAKHSNLSHITTVRLIAKSASNYHVFCSELNKHFS